MLAGDKIFTHSNQGERIPARAMPPAMPEPFIKVDVEVIPGAASMLWVSTGEFSLRFALQADPVVLGDRHQIRLARYGRAAVRGSGWCGQVE
jgi:hypothetical protein